MTLAIVERGARSGEFAACAPSRPWGEGVVAIWVPQGSPAVGVVAIWVPQGSPVVRVVAIWVPQGSPAVGGDDTREYLLGASRRPCGDGFTATDDLFQWRRNLVDGFADFGRRPWRVRQTASIAIVDRAATEPGPPRACLDPDEAGELPFPT
jgi:hypothetical protein